MIEFMENVLKGLGGLLGILVAGLVVTIVGGGLWLILATIGVVTIGLFRFVAWILVGGAMTILILWLIGKMMSGSKDAH